VVLGSEPFNQRGDLGAGRPVRSGQVHLRVTRRRGATAGRFQA
jgi:hypothetical protein